MSIFREIPPTAGFPLYAQDLFSPFLKPCSLEEDFKHYLGVPYAQVTYSGTAAFYIILEALKELSGKKTVIIPSFVCPLVALAIKRAGLKTCVCDIQKDNFNFDSARLEELCLKNKDILAIVAVHLAGIPVDLSALGQIAAKNKIFLIEDCAQSLGAGYQGKKTGAWGDFSFFSLCRGKGLTIYEGGIAVTQNKGYMAAMERAVKRIANRDFFSEGLKIFELFGYWIFYRPQLFWFVYRLPQIFWEWRRQDLRAVTEYFSPDFPVHRVSKIRKNIGHAGFWRLEQEIEKQREKAGYYIERLKNIPGLTLVTESIGAKANYPYLTLIFADPKNAQKTKTVLRSSRLGVSQVYALAITDYDYLKDAIEIKNPSPNARSLAQRHLTLSTSSFLQKKDLDNVVARIKSLVTPEF